MRLPNAWANSRANLPRGSTGVAHRVPQPPGGEGGAGSGRRFLIGGQGPPAGAAGDVGRPVLPLARLTSGLWLQAGRRVALAAGVGATPVRALLEDLPAGADPVVLLRASSEEQLLLANEVMELARGRGGGVARARLHVEGFDASAARGEPRRAGGPHY